MHRGQIDDLTSKVQEKGLTLVPLRMYIKNHRAKVELGLARGRRLYDKRAAIARRGGGPADAAGGAEGSRQAQLIAGAAMPPGRVMLKFVVTAWGTRGFDRSHGNPGLQAEAPWDS